MRLLTQLLSMFGRRRLAAASASRYRGNAVLDAALVLPILLAVAAGTAEFGYYFYVKHTLQGASRDGARVAIVPSATQAQVTTAVSNAMSAAGFPSNKYTLTTNPSNIATAASGASITVTVQSTWSNIGVSMTAVPLISPSKQVVGVTVMRKE